MSNPYKLRRTIARVAAEMIDKQGYLNCQRCGRTSPGMALSFHHIIYRSEAPKHPNLHHEDNLLICCPDCHSALHNKKALRKGFVVARELYLLFPEIFTLRP